jgi:hypothetical protein
MRHRPAGAQAHAQAGVDLQLSGHTHGGMVRGLDQIVRLANGGYVSGRYDVGGKFPVRPVGGEIGLLDPEATTLCGLPQRTHVTIPAT